MEGEEKNQPETPNKNHKECNWRDWSHFQPFGCFITCLDAGGISTSPGQLICGPDTPSERPESKPLASQPLFWVRKVSTAWWPCPGIQEGSEELPKLARWTMESCDFKQKGVEGDSIREEIISGGQVGAKEILQTTFGHTLTYLSCVNLFCGNDLEIQKSSKRIE